MIPTINIFIKKNGLQTRFDYSLPEMPLTDYDSFEAHAKLNFAYPKPGVSLLNNEGDAIRIWTTYTFSNEEREQLKKEGKMGEIATP